MTEKRIANKTACDAVSKAVNYVIYQFPLEGHVLTRLPVFVIPSTGESGETAFCCKQGLFFYDEFILGLIEDKTQNNIGQRHLWFLILHELRHYIYLHVNRWMDFSPILNDANKHSSAQLFNIAADYVINGDLVNDYGDMQEAFKPEFIPSGIIDKTGQYTGMSAEEIYFALLKEQQQKGSKSGAAGQQGETDSSLSSGSKRLEVHDLRDATEEELAQGKAVSNVSQQGKEIDNDELVKVIHTGIQIAKIKGKAPASAERILKELVQTKTAWNVQLRKFMRGFEKGSLNYCRPNRRFLSQGMIMPSSAKKLRLKHVVLAMDTSGSISEKELNLFASEVNKLVVECRVETLTVIFADSNVANVQTFKRPKENIGKKLIPAGGGGTDFRPAFDYVKRHTLNPDVFIYFTDLYGSFPDKSDAPKATIWAVPEEGKYIDVPFGQKLIVDVI